MKREIVILAASSKHGGFCVAGVDSSTGEWLRLVSGNVPAHGALSARDITYRNGGLCATLDVVSVDLVRAVPLEHQPENYLINTCNYWKKTGVFTLADVLRVHPAEVRQYLYGNNLPYLDSEKIVGIHHSLTLVKVSNLTIRQVTNPFGQPKTKAEFIYSGKPYSNISVTAPRFYSIPDGTRYDAAYMVVSLPDAPYGGYYYKFIAQIYPCL